MRDYLNANEKNQFMVLQSIVQLIDGLRNTGIDGPKITNMLEEWTNRSNMSKDEHKNLKTAETFLRKFLASVYERLSQKEQDVIKKKIMKFDFKLVDDFTLKQVHRDIADRFVNAAVPRQQFNDWCSEIMSVKCNRCTKNWNECELHTVFDNNFIPESGFNCGNCKYAYQLDGGQN
jgi:CRISPR/Cas system Type II protein with McrA/HNH and RuvC-like nuclease domain